MLQRDLTIEIYNKARSGEIMPDGMRFYDEYNEDGCSVGIYLYKDSYYMSHPEGNDYNFGYVKDYTLGEIRNIRRKKHNEFSRGGFYEPSNRLLFHRGVKELLEEILNSNNHSTQMKRIKAS